VNELDLFRGFRGGVAPPSEHAKQRASEQLTAAIEGEDRRGTRVLRLIRRRPGRAGLVLATVVVATGVMLFASTPWQSSPGFLERAEAALTTPPRKVLHFKVVIASSLGPSCTVTQPPVEYWVDKTPPYTYRAFEVNQPNPCKAGTPIEIGGEAASRKSLMFRPPNAFATMPRWSTIPPTGPDPVVVLRQALDDGAAHHEGRMMLDGRTVERIRFDCIPAKFPTCDPIFAYVDPESLHPVRVEWGGGRSYQDFVTYEYLPGTPKNRALADIREKYPDATPVARKGQP
jgi:hypothetical protein